MVDKVCWVGLGHECKFGMVRVASFLKSMRWIYSVFERRVRRHEFRKTSNYLDFFNFLRSGLFSRWLPYKEHKQIFFYLISWKPFIF